MEPAALDTVPDAAMLLSRLSAALSDPLNHTAATGGEEEDETQEVFDREGKCAVCMGDESHEDNQLVQCEGCRLGVHEKCYGIEGKIPPGDEPWWCEPCADARVAAVALPRQQPRAPRPGFRRKSQVGVERSVESAARPEQPPPTNPRCIACPRDGSKYALKRCAAGAVGKYVHAACMQSLQHPTKSGKTIYGKNLPFWESTNLDGAEVFSGANLDLALNDPFNASLECALCTTEADAKSGLKIMCGAIKPKSCQVPFHVTCVLEHGLKEFDPEVNNPKLVFKGFEGFCCKPEWKHLASNVPGRIARKQALLAIKAKEVAPTAPPPSAPPGALVHTPLKPSDVLASDSGPPCAWAGLAYHEGRLGAVYLYPTTVEWRCWDGTDVEYVVSDAWQAHIEIARICSASASSANAPPPKIIQLGGRLTRRCHRPRRTGDATDYKFSGMRFVHACDLRVGEETFHVLTKHGHEVKLSNVIDSTIDSLDRFSVFDIIGGGQRGQLFQPAFITLVPPSTGLGNGRFADRGALCASDGCRLQFWDPSYPGSDWLMLGDQGALPGRDEAGVVLKGQLEYCSGVTCDDEHLYLAENGAESRVLKIDLKSARVEAVSTSECGLRCARGVALLGGNLYVADWTCNRIVGLDAANLSLRVADATGEADLLEPYAMASGFGLLFVSDTRYPVRVFRVSSDASLMHVSDLSCEPVGDAISSLTVAVTNAFGAALFVSDSGGRVHAFSLIGCDGDGAVTAEYECTYGDHNFDGLTRKAAALAADKDRLYISDMEGFVSVARISAGEPMTPPPAAKALEDEDGAMEAAADEADPVAAQPCPVGSPRAFDNPRNEDTTKFHDEPPATAVRVPALRHASATEDMDAADTGSARKRQVGVDAAMQAQAPNKRPCAAERADGSSSLSVASSNRMSGGASSSAMGAVAGLAALLEAMRSAETAALAWCVEADVDDVKQIVRTDKVEDFVAALGVKPGGLKDKLVRTRLAAL